MPEQIDVISVFRNSSVRPVKFRYAGRTHRIARILYNWVSREGSFPVHHFSVQTDAGDRFQIELNTYSMVWALFNNVDGATRG